MRINLHADAARLDAWRDMDWACEMDACVPPWWRQRGEGVAGRATCATRGSPPARSRRASCRVLLNRCCHSRPCAARWPNSQCISQDEIKREFQKQMRLRENEIPAQLTAAYKRAVCRRGPPIYGRNAFREEHEVATMLDGYATGDGTVAGYGGALALM